MKGTELRQTREQPLLCSALLLEKASEAENKSSAHLNEIFSVHLYTQLVGEGLNFLENNSHSPLIFARLFCPTSRWRAFYSKSEVLFPTRERFSLALLRLGARL